LHFGLLDRPTAFSAAGTPVAIAARVNYSRLVHISAICLAILASARFSSAASLTVAWDTITSTYVGYVVSYGTQSGVYSTSIDVGTQTSQTISGLTAGVTYYVVVQAYDVSSGLLSLPSPEVSGQPTTALSILCPAPSATSLDGNPVVLTFAPAVSGGTAPVSSSCVPASGSVFPVGSTALSCTAVDAKMLSASCTSSAVVTYNPPAPAAVSPTIPPLSISCPLIAPVVSPSGNPVNVYFSPTVTGGLAPVSTSCVPVSGSLFSVGATAITCTATDAQPQVTSCATSVTVTSTKSSSPTSTGVPTQFDGLVATLTGACPTATFTVGTVSVTTSSVTNYTKGSCSSLKNGKTVHVQGLVQPDATVVATAITFIK
jgi:Domain of unknown function (DUF5666)/Fibronectin type III domain